MTRFRHTQLATDRPVVTTHCTIDSGPGTVQTAITFRCSDNMCDVVSVTRPEPDKRFAANDHTSVSRLI
jgi:hypothetical protein